MFCRIVSLRNTRLFHLTIEEKQKHTHEMSTNIIYIRWGMINWRIPCDQKKNIEIYT